jgi:hypothetical protein
MLQDMETTSPSLEERKMIIHTALGLLKVPTTTISSRNMPSNTLLLTGGSFVTDGRVTQNFRKEK